MTRPRAALALLAACVALGVPSALAASGGTYEGKIKGGGKEVQVKVKDNRVTRFTTEVYASCGLSNFTIEVAYPPAGQKGRSARIKNGKFTAVFKGSPDIDDDRRTIKGTFDGSKVTGTVKVRGLCSTDAKYSAKR